MHEYKLSYSFSQFNSSDSRALYVIISARDEAEARDTFNKTISKYGKTDVLSLMLV